VGKLDSVVGACLNSYVADTGDGSAATAVFKALADPTRRQILQELHEWGPLPAGEVASKFPISAPSISRHLAVLKAAGLVKERREANRIIYSLVPERLVASLGSFLASLCPEQPQGPEEAPSRQAKKQKKAKGANKSADKHKHKPVTAKSTERVRTGADGNGEGEPLDHLPTRI
jgi:DNA-binding transcriptional ArsR family regulator